jgi:hypothetical protein
MGYLKEVFQDIDGYYSFKRLAVAVIVGLFAMAVSAPFFGVHFPDLIVSTLSDMFKWGIGFIAAEHASKFAPATATAKDDQV